MKLEFLVFTKCCDSRSQCPLSCWDCGFESHRGHACLSVVSVVCCAGRGLCDGLITRRRAVLPTVLRPCVWSRDLVNEEALADWGEGPLRPKLTKMWGWTVKEGRVKWSRSFSWKTCRDSYCPLLKSMKLTFTEWVGSCNTRDNGGRVWGHI